MKTLSHKDTKSVLKRLTRAGAIGAVALTTGQALTSLTPVFAEDKPDKKTSEQKTSANTENAPNGLSVKTNTEVLDKVKADAEKQGIKVIEKPAIHKLAKSGEGQAEAKAASGRMKMQATQSQAAIEQAKQANEHYATDHKTWTTEKVSNEKATAVYKAANEQWKKDQEQYEKNSVVYIAAKKVFDEAHVKWVEATAQNVKDTQVYNQDMSDYTLQVKARQDSIVKRDAVRADNQKLKSEFETHLAKYHTEMQDVNKIVRDTGEFKAKNLANLIGQKELPNVVKLQGNQGSKKMSFESSNLNTLSAKQVWKNIQKYGATGGSIWSQAKSERDVNDIMKKKNIIVFVPKNNDKFIWKHAMNNPKTGRDTDYSLTLKNIQHFPGQKSDHNMMSVYKNSIKCTPLKPISSVQYNAKLTDSATGKPDTMSLLIGVADIDFDQYYRLNSNGGLGKTKYVLGSKLAVKNGKVYTPSHNPSENTDTSNQIWFALNNISEFTYTFGADEANNVKYEDVMHQAGGDGLAFYKPNAPVEPKYKTESALVPEAKKPTPPTPVGEEPVPPVKPVEPTKPTPVDKLREEPKKPELKTLIIQKEYVYESITAKKDVEGDPSGLIKQPTDSAKDKKNKSTEAAIVDTTGKKDDATKNTMSLDNATVVVGKELTYQLKVSDLPANRHKLASYELTDKIPAGLDTDGSRLTKHLDTQLWQAKLKDGVWTYTATPKLLKQMNADTAKPFHITPATLTGIASKPNIELTNTFDVKTTEEGGDKPVTTTSNKVKNKTPKAIKGSIKKAINDASEAQVNAGSGMNYSLDVTLGNVDEKGKPITDNIVNDQLEKVVVYKNIASVQSDNKELNDQLQAQKDQAKVDKDNHFSWKLKDTTKYAGQKITIRFNAGLKPDAAHQDGKAPAGHAVDYKTYKHDKEYRVPNTAELTGTPLTGEPSEGTKSNTVYAHFQPKEKPHEKAANTGSGSVTWLDQVIAFFAGK